MELKDKKIIKYVFGLFGDEAKANGPIIEPEKEIKPWFLENHPELIKNSYYALAGSMWNGQLRFKIDEKIFWGDELNVVQHVGGTGYCIYVIDKNNPIKQ